MALTYDKVINVISQKPEFRKDFEVNNLLSWFRKKSQLFANLKTELLFDIIKNLQFARKDRDDLIIKQGEPGDCMYILLRGQITIYILYAAKGDAEDEKPKEPLLTAKDSNALRQQLGTFVTNLGPGATFGEVALMSEDCIRTASIIVNEPSDLIIVDRELYNRSVKNVLKQEFEDKSNFIANNPYFQGWPPKYKKQLAMALQKETVPYEGVLTKQGDSVEAIYFILYGEIKMVVDPTQHRVQYIKLLEAPEENPLTSDKPKAQTAAVVVEDEEDVIKTLTGSKDVSSPEQSSHKFRRKPVKKQPQEVCLLGVNESIGDLEVLLDLDTYLQTAICTQRTDVLVLEMKHYERLLVKRNPKTIDNMKEDVELKILSRMNKHTEKYIPVFRCLLKKAEEYNQQRQQQVVARHNAVGERQTKHSVKTISETYDSFIPPQGPLVDMYGPGTVFYRIRQREAAKVKKQERLRTKGFGTFHGITNTTLLNGTQSHGLTEQALEGMRYGSGGPRQVDPLTSDPVLSDLEGRMRAWLANEYGTLTQGSISSSRSQPRIAKLHRATSEADNIKPGAKIIIRPRVHRMTPLPGVLDEEQSFVQNGHSWVALVT